LEEDLILASKSGDQVAFGELLGRYEPLIAGMTDKYFASAAAIGAEKDDIRQEAHIAFHRAVMAYDATSKEVTFGLFAKICVRNRIISYIRKLSAAARSESESEVLPSLEAEYIKKENLAEFYGIIESSLTEYEKSVLKQFIQNKSYRCIAETLGTTEKSVDNAIYRIKRKLKKLIS